MTDGRFETVHNLRPRNWDVRRHWTNWHHAYDCADDHLARESCPFHDLRAGGQFQYEHAGGGGPYTAPVPAHGLNARACGDRMDLALDAGGPQHGIGGRGNALPLDTTPAGPTRASIVPRSRAVFTKASPLRRGLFSEYAYMPLGDDTATDGSAAGDGMAALRPTRPRVGALRAGRAGCGHLGRAHEYIADPYTDKPDRGRIAHFRTGPVPHDYPAWMPQGPDVTSLQRRRRRERRPPCAPWLAGKAPLGAADGCLGGDVEWIADPHAPPRIRGGGRPMHTWHTRTKWSMPTHAPWSSGLATSEPRMAPTLDLSDRATLPGLRTYTNATLPRTIGAEAALTLRHGALDK